MKLKLRALKTRLWLLPPSPEGFEAILAILEALDAITQAEDRDGQKATQDVGNGSDTKTKTKKTRTDGGFVSKSHRRND